MAFYAGQLAYFGFFLKESVLREMEKQFSNMEILKKDVKDIMARSGKPKTMNNGPTTLAQNFVYVPQSLKTRSQNKGKTSLKT